MDLILPDAPWRTRPGLAGLCAALGAEAREARFVGGAVRDTLLGNDVADIDVATVHPPDRVLALLKDAGIKAVPTGLTHGTITAVTEGGPVEVTTLRCDLVTDGRHATVAFGTDWQADAARRDFTINALYADPIGGAVLDWFGGIDDLREGRVRFIGDPLRRIAEDHLRILRFFRFLARFGSEPDADGLAACAARANDLMALSRERIASEVLRLLVARRAPEVVALMIASGIFAPVLPEVSDASLLTTLAAREAAAAVTPDPIRRLAALLPPDPGIAADIGARLKLSNAQRKQLESAARRDTLPPRALGYRLGVAGAIDRLLLAGEDIATLRDWTPPTLPITGGALVAMGLDRGPDVAAALRRVEDRWIEEGFPDAARVEEIARAEVLQRRLASSA